MPAKTKSFTDEYFGATMSFISKDGSKRLRFSPCLLAIYSDPLTAMFTDDFKEKDANEIIIPDDEFEGMEHILRLWFPIPDRVVPVNEDNVKSILPVANKYLMVHVVEQCDLKLVEMTSDECLDAMRELVVQYPLPNLAFKCDELWKIRMSTSDCELALDGICEGINKKEFNLVNICLPLCIWRKDFLIQLKSRNTEIPKKLLLYFNDCLGCKILPWNADWRVVHDINRQSYDYSAPTIDPKEACYACDEFSRMVQCVTCDHWLCQRCQLQSHSQPRMCVQFNYKMSGVQTPLSYFQSRCMSCEMMITGQAKDFEDHVDNCEEKLNEKISWYLTKNNLNFDKIDWFVE